MVVADLNPSKNQSHVFGDKFLASTYCSVVGDKLCSSEKVKGGGTKIVSVFSVLQ